MSITHSLKNNSESVNESFMAFNGEPNNHMPKEFFLRGHGWGHGVGLCQIGAAEMAMEGFSYQQILSHYYPSSVLSTYQEQQS